VPVIVISTYLCETSVINSYPILYKADNVIGIEGLELKSVVTDVLIDIEVTPKYSIALPVIANVSIVLTCNKSTKITALLPVLLNTLVVVTL
jgi:hypothetical protein